MRPSVANEVEIVSASIIPLPRPAAVQDVTHRGSDPIASGQQDLIGGVGKGKCHWRGTRRSVHVRYVEKVARRTAPSGLLEMELDV